jgi:hypothetical protein
MIAGGMKTEYLPELGPAPLVTRRVAFKPPLGGEGLGL